MAKTENISFEEAMERLESAVAKLEGGSLTLDESIKEFENAVKLIGICEKKITDAKQRVRILTEGSDGTVTDEPFTNTDDET
jgi:exodeoxyribonuclease VII small subunit